MTKIIFATKKMTIIFWPLLMAAFFLLVSCAPPPPHDKLNICKIFNQYPSWYKASKASYQKWGVPIDVQLAVIYQESSFNAHSKPPRRKILGAIPWKRASSAKGYAQALDGTWKNYMVRNGKSANRSNFADVTDFIGWYGAVAHQADSIPKNNAYDLYLAYHEGFNGYAHHSYEKNPAIMHIAHRVAYNAAHYHAQLSRCEAYIPKRSWWLF